MPVAEERMHKRPHPTTAQMTGPFLQFDLQGELEQMRREQGWKDGHTAKTLVKHDDFRVVLIALDKDGKLPEHRTSGRFSVQTVRGRVRLRALGRTFDLPAGALLALDRDIPHDVEALEESAILVSISWRGEPAPDGRWEGDAGRGDQPARQP